ncbi:MAG TPA: AAA family ATPase, partial [Burkholderiaceae bacterium]|nr:AAA family ATPase [Burkholderiaceae bacterium]
MRLQSLELIRYGHFTGQALVFPRSNCDFHLVVGANEAGKSTLRRAVSELLFGMPLRSEMGFRHPLAELRLGAAIESAAGTLAFHRARGRRSLRRPDDGALADTALAEHLGGTTAGLFERMFCLDLAGLLEGGQTILDARDDVGQLLFQSAAGLSSLGRLRDALAAEADGLYAPRRSGSRAFYTALDAYEAARQALRGATVPTRAWTAAQDEVQRLDTATAEAAARYRDLSAQRQRLERLRRIAPRVAQLRDLLAQQTASAGLPLLPEDAAQRLAEGEVTLATQTSRADLLRQTGQALQTQEAALTDDDAILALADAVEALAAQAQACVHHPRDIGRREEEVQARLRQAAAAGTELGWPADEAALRSRRPSSLALKAVSALMQQHGALRQAWRSTEEALERARALLARWQPASVPPRPEIADGLVTDLQAALREAQSLQAGSGRLSSLQAAVAQTRQQLDAALAALGTWRMEPAALAALPLPSEERLAVLKAERADLAAGLQAARQQLTQAQEAARRSALALAQFTAAQQVVTPDDVREARTARDRLWAAIKSRQAALAEAAAGLDHAIERADELVDRQRDQASQSAQLVSLRQALDRDDAAAQAAARHAEAAAARLADFESQWDLQASACGLPGMALLDLSGWAVNRRAVLEAAATLADRTGELTALQQAESRAATALAQALCACGVATPAPSTLAALCSRAEQWLADRQAERAQDAARSEQLAQAQAEFDHQTQQWQRCSADLALWNAHWLEALQAASLPADELSPETALAAIERVEQVRDLLHEIDELRVQRIQTMQRDLADFSRSAQALRLALGEPEAVAASADEGFAWARALRVRLQRAREMRRERDRLQAARRDNDA